MRRRSLFALIGVLLVAVAAFFVGRAFPASEPRVTTIQTEHFTVQLHTRRTAAAKKYMEYLEKNIDRVEKLVGVDVEQRPEVVLYDGDSFPSGGLNWVVGFFDGERLQMSLDPRGSGNTADSLPKVALHEYVHFLVDSRARGRAVPIWLTEGIALYAANQNRSNLPAAELVPLGSINPSQSSNPEIDYSESYMAVNCIVSRVGVEKIPSLVDAYASGNPEALKSVCGFTEAELVAILGGQPK